ncbi:MAG: hypothetical protein ACYDDF_09730 [Thermoplasmatota archaeon]
MNAVFPKIRPSIAKVAAWRPVLTDQQGRNVAFAVMQYMSDTPTAAAPGSNATAGCGVNFIPNSPHSKLDSFSIVGGHEYAEAITDPYPATGWIAPGGESGDLCEFNWSADGGYQEISLPTGSYGVQGLWSNAASGCRVAYP